jgi:cell division protease FtsH
MTKLRTPQVQRRKDDGDESSFWRKFLLLILISLAAFTFFKPVLDDSANPRKEVTFSEFNAMAVQGQIASAKINTADSSVDAVLKDKKRVHAYILVTSELMPFLEQKGIDVSVTSPNQNWISGLIGSVVVPFLLFAGLWFFIFRQAQGANNQAMSFGRARAKEWSQDGKVKTTFKDVAGADEAVEELKEIVEFLKEPKKFQAIGAKIPRGALLMGPPGCGKTLLARAIAGEAGVAFLNISGSDFVEMFVGVGASRVRDLFTQAKKIQPAIIFVDEIDAVGRHRGAGLGGGHDEREQTLNQLLVEMDGFDDKASVIVIAATNRPDVLDPALLRPGRFDRQVVIDRPDVKGREQILKIHASKVKQTADVDLNIIAKRTPGFTGADLANVMNEGALLAARRDKKMVEMVDLEDAIDRVIAGPEKKSKIMSKHEKEVVAYHEVGHALVARMIPNTDPVHKISILPRGLALGYTLQLPLEDKYLVAKQEILDQVAILLGGRVAEELIFGEITSGASNDIEKATKLVHQMVCQYGMSDLGTRAFGKTSHNVFLGKDFSDHDRDYGQKTADAIDTEIDHIINEGYVRAKKIVQSKKALLKTIAADLMKSEVIEGKDLEKYFH